MAAVPVDRRTSPSKSWKHCLSCRWYWDGDVVPKRPSIDLSGLNVREESRFGHEDALQWAFPDVAPYPDPARPDVKILLAGWDFFGTWRSDEVRTLFATLDPSSTVLCDYEGAVLRLRPRGFLAAEIRKPF